MSDFSFSLRVKLIFCHGDGFCVFDAECVSAFSANAADYRRSKLFFAVFADEPFAYVFKFVLVKEGSTFGAAALGVLFSFGYESACYMFC